LKDGKTSRYRGVHYDARFRSPWWAAVTKDYVQHRERFETEDDAARWYNRKATELFGEFAVLNDVPPPRNELH
jgi:hypothetical protein